jgi:hypothetical protein
MARGVAAPPPFLCGAIPDCTDVPDCLDCPADRRWGGGAATFPVRRHPGGDGDAASRLAPGLVVMVYAPEPATEVTATDPAADGRYPLAVGSKVRVVDDAAEGGPGRPVRVAAGLVGDLCRVPRENLRPAR